MRVAGRSSRILVASLYHEAHSFSPLRTDRGCFVELRGEALLAKANSSASGLGGGVRRLMREGAEPIPSLSAVAAPGGLINDDVYCAFRDEIVPWLAERARAGFVRRAHGDLHLGNLCLWQGRPVPFDALEFDEDLATIDLGYDLAFLLMDIEARADRAAANRVLNRYVARSGDVALTRGLPLWLSCRAMVRAHVLARLGRAEAARYLAVAEAALDPPPPCLVAIGGLQGTGKTTLARALAPALGAAPGALILRSDEIRKRLAGCAPEDRLPPDAYTRAATAAVYAALEQGLATALAAGHAAIADAVFLDPAERARIEAIATGAGVTFRGLWLEAPRTVLEARLLARQGDASDADVAVLREAAARDPGPITWARLDASDPAVQDRARNLIANP